MEQTFLCGTIRERLQDLMKSRKVSQAELATRIGCTESTLSRFLSGRTDKLGDESVIRIARVFNVSTDFLLGETDVPDRVTYDISELGLSVQAARNLYTQKVNPKVVNALLENPEFAETTELIAGFLNDEFAKGFALQNELYSLVGGMVQGVPEAAADVRRLETPPHQFDLMRIQESFMAAVRSVKTEVGCDLNADNELTAQMMKRIYVEVAKGQHRRQKKVSPKDVGAAIAKALRLPPGEKTQAVIQQFLNLTEAVTNDESGRTVQ